MTTNHDNQVFARGGVATTAAGSPVARVAAHTHGHSSKFIVGADVDTKAIALAFARDGVLCKTATIPRLDRTGNYHGGYLPAVRRLFAWCASHEARVTLEDTYLGPSPKTYRALCETHGELSMLAFEAGVTVHRVMPVIWMRAILGVSKDRERIKSASMQHAARWAIESGIEPPSSQHEADACGICRWALQTGRGEAHETQIELRYPRKQKRRTGHPAPVGG